MAPRRRLGDADIADLVGSSPRVCVMSGKGAETLFARVADEAKGMTGDVAFSAASCDILVASGRPGVVACCRDAGRLTGAYVSGQLWVAPDWRRSGVGKALVRAAWEFPVVPATPGSRGLFTPAGLAAHVAAHAEAALKSDAEASTFLVT